MKLIYGEKPFSVELELPRTCSTTKALPLHLLLSVSLIVINVKLLLSETARYCINHCEMRCNT